MWTPGQGELTALVELRRVTGDAPSRGFVFEVLEHAYASACEEFRAQGSVAEA